MKKRLTNKEEAFCVEYVKLGDGHGNVVAAYKHAYQPQNGKPDTHYSRGSEVYRKPHVQARIAELRQRIADRVMITKADIIKIWYDIATANPNEIMQARRLCCRYCYGIDHRYQWVEVEYAMAAAKAISNGQDTPDGSGGFGFNGTLAPHAKCPMCFGEGIENIYIADTRKLTGKAQVLYGGVKKKRGGGVEIVLRNQDEAVKNLARFFGLDKDGGGQLPNPSGEITNEKLTIETVDAMEAAAAYQRIMKS